MNAGVNQQLSEYFRGEVPKAFPPCPGGEAVPASVGRSWPRTVAYALAASLLLALGLKIIPSGPSKSSTIDDPFGRATADGKIMKAAKSTDHK
jgi:hypothetical protein